MASSTDGRRLIASGYNRQLMVSTNAGATWTARSYSSTWSAVASSGDGRVLVSIAMGNQINVSSDYGVTWNGYSGNQAWTAIAVSEDGAMMIASEDRPALQVPRRGLELVYRDRGLPGLARGGDVGRRSSTSRR